MLTPPFAEPPVSWIRTVTVADPLAFAAGAYVRVPVGLIEGPAEKRFGWSAETWKFTFWPDSSGAPLLMSVAQPVTVCAPAPSPTDWSGPLVKLGASFTAVTLITNVWLGLALMPPFAVPPSSWRWMVMVADPLAFEAGV